MSSIQLASGKFFDFRDFTDVDIAVRDIAASTAKLCRFTGHCREFYSVAQHSVLVSRLVPPELAMVGLLHDATEAYMNDLSRPLKEELPEYVMYEKFKLWPIIALHFGLPRELPKCVKEADNIALVTERRDLMPRPRVAKGKTDPWAWAADIPRLPEKIKPLDWRMARLSFLNRYAQLKKRGRP